MVKTRQFADLHNNLAISRKLSSFLFGLLFYVLGGYFLYSTGSYYNLVRRRNINSTIIVQSVSQGTHCI